MIKGNKGEWSEIFVLFKLLGDKFIAPGNEHIEKIQNILYPIIKILRTESNGNFEYFIQDEIVVISGNEEVFKIPVQEFNEKASILFAAIKANKKGTFSVPVVEEFMQRFSTVSLKAKSSKKTDITIVIHDIRTGQQPILGFSIKSRLGSSSTLLNAGEATNVIYRVNGLQLNSDEVDEINNINSRSKIKDRVEVIRKKGGQFEFLKMESSMFVNNLILIDSLLPQILAHVVFDFFTSGINLK